MLEELVKKHKLWINYAFIICKNKDVSKDLVQDMYIKLANKEKVNHRYVFLTLKSIYLNSIKKDVKIISIEDILHLEDKQNNDIAADIQECMKGIKWMHREILKITSNHSLRESERLLNVNYGVLHYQKNKALEKLKKIYHGQK